MGTNNKRLMSIKPLHYDKAQAEALRRRRITGQDIRWQDIIRHAIELGIGRALQYTGSGQWPTTNELTCLSQIRDDVPVPSRICPITKQPVDCPANKLCRDCKEKT